MLTRKELAESGCGLGFVEFFPFNLIELSVYNCGTGWDINVNGHSALPDSDLTANV
jgi:hypothetical protein